jgi:putative ABC transport system ATP-binding protein
VNAPLIDLRGVQKRYAGANGPTVVLDGVDLAIERGDFVSIMGPSGSGKSTLLNLVGALDTPSEGQIVFDGVRIDDMPDRARTRWRAANVGFVFQFYNLMGMLTAEQNVELPLLLTPLSARERRDRVRAALAIVDLQERTHHRPSQLSGGQQQRVAIARALVCGAPLLLCDEPTGNLDRDAASEVMAMLEALNREQGRTIVLVTHDPQAARHARRCLHLDKGAFERELQ